jgi:hypothetical protein
MHEWKVFFRDLQLNSDSWVDYKNKNSTIRNFIGFSVKEKLLVEEQHLSEEAELDIKSFYHQLQMKSAGFSGKNKLNKSAGFSSENPVHG